jgi:hypothetical protein
MREDKRAEDVVLALEKHRTQKKRVGPAPEIAGIPRAFGYADNSLPTAAAELPTFSIAFLLSLSATLLDLPAMLDRTMPYVRVTHVYPTRSG